MKFRCSPFAFFWVAVFLFTSIASATALPPLISCSAADPGWVTTTADNWQDIYWDGQPGNQIAQCELYATTPLTELRVLDAYTSGDMYKVEISGAQTMTLYTSRVPLSATDDTVYIYAIQVWWNLDAAWALEKYYSRLAIWLPPEASGNHYTVKIFLYRPAADEELSTLALPVWFSRGEVFVRAVSFAAPEGISGSSSLHNTVHSLGVSDRTSNSVSDSAARAVRKWANGGPLTNSNRH
jgi:hypothetical protein